MAEQSPIIILDANTHSKIFSPGATIIVSEASDQALFLLSNGARITDTTLPSGLKMPKAPDRYAWIVISNTMAQLLPHNMLCFLSC